MDPNPKKFPILSHVLAKLPTFSSRRTNERDFDIEQPAPAQNGKAKEPKFDLSERMPQLTDGKVMEAMRTAVSDVCEARSVLRNLGDRPDHETVDTARVRVCLAALAFYLKSYKPFGYHEAVDTARVRLAELDAERAMRLDEIALSPRDPTLQVNPVEEEQRGKMEKERDVYKAVILREEMHEAYGKMLNEAEGKLRRIYEAAVAGYDVEEEAKEVAQEEVNEEVLAILKEAFEKKMGRIDISGTQLLFLPEAFGRLQGLVVLNFSSNQLQGLPDSIGGLESLEELHLSSNLLESLPESVGMLLNLKILDVSGNKLLTLPNSICLCRSLVELDVSFNRLTYLPTNIGYELVNLVRLSVHLNKIRSLPTSVGEMISLRSLDMHFNELRSLPSSIGRLTNLENLNLGSNFSDLKELPNTIGNLTNLKELDLNNNQIHALPDTIGLLHNLAKLNLDENPLTVPPMEVVKDGIGAVKAFMAKRWLGILEEEQRRSMLEVNEERPQGWLNRSTSWLNNVVSGVSGYIGSPRSSEASYLDEAR